MPTPRRPLDLSDDTELLRHVLRRTMPLRGDEFPDGWDDHTLTDLLVREVERSVDGVTDAVSPGGSAAGVAPEGSRPGQ